MKKLILLILLLPSLCLAGSMANKHIAVIAKMSPGADIIAPTFSSATVASDGDTVTVLFSELLDDTALGGGEFTLDSDGAGGADNVLVYSSGDGTSTWVFTTTTTIEYDETVTITFDGAANEAEDKADNDLADFGPTGITNLSDIGLSAPNYTTYANCQGAWLFGDDLADASGEGNELTLVGTPPGYSATVPSGFTTGKSYEFDGVADEYLYRTTASDNFPGSGKDSADFTVSLWYKRSAAADTYQSIMYANYSWGLKLGYNTSLWDEFYQVVQDSDSTVFQEYTVNNTTNWYHTVMSFDGSLSKMTVWISSDTGSFGDVLDGATWCPSGCNNVGFSGIVSTYPIGAGAEIVMGIRPDLVEEYIGFIYQPIVFDETLDDVATGVSRPSAAASAEDLYSTGITGAD